MYPPGTGRERLKHFSFPIHVVIADKKGSKVAGKKPSMKLSREQEAVAEKIRGLVRWRMPLVAVVSVCQCLRVFLSGLV
jgi:hypothetical protein